MRSRDAMRWAGVWLSLFCIPGFSSAVSGTVREKYPFIVPDEGLKEIFSGKVFVTEGTSQGTPFLKKIYFTDGKGNVLREHWVFPTVMDHIMDGEVEGTENFIWLYRVYGGRPVARDIQAFDLQGKLVWRSKGDKGQFIFVNGPTGPLLEIFPNEGSFKVHGLSGSGSRTVKYSEQAYVSKAAREEGDGEGSGFSENHLMSDTKKHIAFGRQAWSEGLGAELVLLEGTGRVVFNSSFPKTERAHLITPFGVFDGPKVLVCLISRGENDVHKEKFQAFDFKGQPIWSLEPKTHSIDFGAKLDGEGYLPIKESRTGKYLKLDPKTGKILGPATQVISAH